MALQDRTSRADVFDLLHLLLAHGGELPQWELPEHLETAWTLCLAEPAWVWMDGPMVRLNMEGLAAHDLWPTESGPTATVDRREPADRLSLDAKALAVFIEHPDWTKKRIARQLKCNEKSLAPQRCPKLTAAIEASKAKPTDFRRGSKTADGDMEAWDAE